MKHWRRKKVTKKENKWENYSWGRLSEKSWKENWIFPWEVVLGFVNCHLLWLNPYFGSKTSVPFSPPVRRLCQIRGCQSEARPSLPSLRLTPPSPKTLPAYHPSEALTAPSEIPTEAVFNQLATLGPLIIPFCFQHPHYSITLENVKKRGHVHINIVFYCNAGQWEMQWSVPSSISNFILSILEPLRHFLRPESWIRACPKATTSNRGKPLHSTHTSEQIQCF